MEPTAQLRSLLAWCQDPSNASHLESGCVVGSSSGYICGTQVEYGLIVPIDPEQVQARQLVRAPTTKVPSTGIEELIERILFVAPGTSPDRVITLLSLQIRALEGDPSLLNRTQLNLMS